MPVLSQSTSPMLLPLVQCLWIINLFNNPSVSALILPFLACRRTWHLQVHCLSEALAAGSPCYHGSPLLQALEIIASSTL